MRILFCNYEYPPLGGGGGVVMAALARQLARRHEVTVLTSRAGELAAQANDQGVQVVRVPVFFRRQLAVANFPSMLAYLPSGFVRGLALRRQQFDVINTHFVVPTGPLGHALARAHHLPNVLSVHGGDLFDPSKRSSPHLHAPLRAAVRWLLKAADDVVGQSRDTVRHVNDLYGVHREVGLIPLGIERPPARVVASRATFGLPHDAFVMVTIGRLVARKASTQLVDVLCASGIPNAHLLVIGDGPDATAIRQRAAELGVANRVHLPGQVADAEKYAALSIADAFVSTSQHEGFGLVFLEAMAFALPIVCYDRGGQTDFLASGETGFVVKLNDSGAFTHAVRAIHADIYLRRRLGQRNRQTVENYFIDSCAARYEQVFEAVIDRRLTAHRGVAPTGSSHL
ncbi:MAG TPA: glycosyltransferase family 4 protein [Steroidobacteraceae bacterium]|jgi:glycosyltransferase involved in cell wall biosynthesis|nr:glycosyltransferase family 4 protein [Steroidobacteraceae bacterium]